MKTLVVFIFGVFMIFGAIAQEAAAVQEPQEGAVISFEEDKHDFGDIYQGDKVEHIFTFENTGNEPLIITNVQTTCGCTAPEWPRDPVVPGQTADIKVVFNSAGKMGRQTKVITVVSNATSPSNRVTIVTNVLPKKDGTN